MKPRDRRRNNRHRRNAAREQTLRRFVDAIFFEGRPPEAVPSLPPKSRRALEAILGNVNRSRLKELADMRRDHAREMAEYREMMLPAIARLGALSPGVRNRVPVAPSRARYNAVDGPIAFAGFEQMEVDGRPTYAVVYLLAPEMLRFAVGDVSEHTRNVIAEIAHILGRVIEIEAVRHIIYGLPLASEGQAIGRDLPRSADEVLAEHPLNAYSYVLDTMRRASAAGDWRVAHRFADIGRELQRRGQRGT